MQTEETVQPELELDTKPADAPVEEAPKEAAAEEAEAPKAEAAEAPKEEPKKAKNPTKPFQSRIDELTKNWREEERRREALEARLAELEKGQRQPEEQQERPADVIPANMLDQLAEQKAQQIASQRQFDNDCNLTFMKGKAAFPDFEEALGTFGALGGLSRDVVEDALATDNPHEILYELGKEPERALEIIRLPRNKRIAEMTKMTLKKPAAPSVSKAAAPIKPVAGNTKTDFDYADDKADDSEWFSRRDKERRQAGRL